jgi:hypothetical protein
LGFSVTSHADAAFLAGQVAPEPGQARQEVLQLRQLDLQLALLGLGALGEDIQDQGGAIQNFAFKHL